MARRICRSTDSQACCSTFTVEHLSCFFFLQSHAGWSVIHFSIQFFNLNGDKMFIFIRCIRLKSIQMYKTPSLQYRITASKSGRLKSLAVPLHNASVLSCDLSLPHIIHDYAADMLAHANNFSLEAMSATSYFIIWINLCCVCMWAPRNLYRTVYARVPEIIFCI